MLSYFSEVASPEVVAMLNPNDKKGMIFELETLATALAVSNLLPGAAVRPCDRIVNFS